MQVFRIIDYFWRRLLWKGAEITTNIVAHFILTSLFIKLKSLNTIINVFWTGLVQLLKVPVYCALTFPFIYTFNETLAKKKNIEVIEMIPSTKHWSMGARHDANQKSVIL
jgi:uncharacterized oxidoreductase